MELSPKERENQLAGGTYFLHGKGQAWLEASSHAYWSGTESVNTLPGKCNRTLSQCQMYSKEGYSAFL